MKHSRVVVIAWLILALTACGSPGQDEGGVASLDGSAPPSESAGEAGEADPQAAMLEFAQCMRDNGVDMQDPQMDEDGGMQVGIQVEGPGGSEGERLDPAVLDAAQAACDDLLTAVIGDRPEEVDEAQQQELLDFSECMREQGLDWPDPQFDGGRTTMLVPEGLDPEEIEAAQEVCDEELGGDGTFGITAQPADSGAGS